MRTNHAEFDLFISYAHADDAQGYATALVAQIAATHARFTPRPLWLFFDRDGYSSKGQLP